MGLETTSLETLGRGFGWLLIGLCTAIFSGKGKEAYRKITSHLRPHDAVLKRRISHAVDELRIRHGFSRVKLFQFTNGVKTMGGYTKKYMEITHDSFNAEYMVSIKDSFKQIALENIYDDVINLQNADKYMLGPCPLAFNGLMPGDSLEYKLDNKEIYMGFLSINFDGRGAVDEKTLKDIQRTSLYIYSIIKSMKK